MLRYQLSIMLYRGLKGYYVALWIHILLTDVVNATYSYHECMSMPCSLGNVYMAKSCKGGEWVPDALIWGPVSWGREPWHKHTDPPGLLRVGIGQTTQPRKIICRKISKKERKGPTQGWQANYDDDDDDYFFLWNILSLHSGRNSIRTTSDWNWDTFILTFLH
jgi:hypothetical protein